MGDVLAVVLCLSETRKICSRARYRPFALMMASACTTFVKEVWADYLSREGFNTLTMSTVEIIEATPGFVQASMKITKPQTNRSGNLHGGMVCSPVDTIGSLALASKGLASSGASTDIHTTFVRSAGVEGDTIMLEGRVLNLGRTLAYTETKLIHAETGNVLATGLHTKFVGRSLDHPKNVQFDDSGNIVAKGEDDVGQQQSAGATDTAQTQQQGGEAKP